MNSILRIEANGPVSPSMRHRLEVWVVSSANLVLYFPERPERLLQGDDLLKPVEYGYRVFGRQEWKLLTVLRPLFVVTETSYPLWWTRLDGGFWLNNQDGRIVTDEGENYGDVSKERLFGLREEGLKPSEFFEADLLRGVQRWMRIAELVKTEQLAGVGR